MHNNFTVAKNKLINHIEERLLKVATHLAEKIKVDLMEATPIDSGAAYNNWDIKSKKSKEGITCTIFNSISYAPILEYGEGSGISDRFMNVDPDEPSRLMYVTATGSIRMGVKDTDYTPTIPSIVYKVAKPSEYRTYSSQAPGGILYEAGYRSLPHFGPSDRREAPPTTRVRQELLASLNKTLTEVFAK